MRNLTSYQSGSMSASECSGFDQQQATFTSSEFSAFRLQHTRFFFCVKIVSWSRNLRSLKVMLFAQYSYRIQHCFTDFFFKNLTIRFVSSNDYWNPTAWSPFYSWRGLFKPNISRMNFSKKQSICVQVNYISFSLQRLLKTNFKKCP